jgi:hypothetical protein
MSRPVKIILFAFALFVAVVAAGIAGLIFVGKSLMQDTTDPATERRIAAKLATFTVPPGYHISHALDFVSRQEIELSPNDPHSSFKIKLTGGSGLGNDPSAQSAGVDIGLRLVGGFAKCDFAAQPDDHVVVAGVPTTLQVRACPQAAVPMRIETGTLPHAVLLTALGAGQNFDTAGLHALLRSFK